MTKSLSRDALARLVAAHLPQQGFVNLGIGAPSQVADHLAANSDVILHSENGILNIGPRPSRDEEDWDLINASKSPVTIKSGGSYFDSNLSFAMMRGGHIDVAILGAFQVSKTGDLANWTTGENNGSPPGVGGAIDLAVGAKSIWVMMDHTTREGHPRIVEQCTYPLTAVGVVRRIFTNLAIVDITPTALVIAAILEGLSVDALQSATATALVAGDTMQTISLDGAIHVH